MSYNINSNTQVNAVDIFLITWFSLCSFLSNSMTVTTNSGFANIWVIKKTSPIKGSGSLFPESNALLLLESTWPVGASSLCSKTCVNKLLSIPSKPFPSFVLHLRSIHGSLEQNMAYFSIPLQSPTRRQTPVRIHDNRRTIWKQNRSAKRI